MFAKLIDRVVADPNNDLARMGQDFQASGELCWHIDRHVFTVDDAVGPSIDPRKPGVMAAFALARKWSAKLDVLRKSELLVSTALVVVDDGWLAGVLGAPPPHVYICMAREENSFTPVAYEYSSEHLRSGVDALDRHLTGQETLSRVDGAFDGEPGAWILQLGDRP